MKKIISFVGLFAVLGVGIGDAHGVAMSVPRFAGCCKKSRKR